VDVANAAPRAQSARMISTIATMIAITITDQTRQPNASASDFKGFGGSQRIRIAARAPAPL
jgi:hypothetical protein